MYLLADIGFGGIRFYCTAHLPYSILCIHYAHQYPQYFSATLDHHLYISEARHEPKSARQAFAW